MLHGEIKINGDAIAAWSARRLTEGISEVNWYEWTYRAAQSSLVRKGRLQHRYSDGAAVLARKVMEAATGVSRRTARSRRL